MASEQEKKHDEIMKELKAERYRTKAPQAELQNQERESKRAERGAALCLAIQRDQLRVAMKMLQEHGQSELDAGYFDANGMTHLHHAARAICVPLFDAILARAPSTIDAISLLFAHTESVERAQLPCRHAEGL